MFEEVFRYFDWCSFESHLLERLKLRLGKNFWCKLFAIKGVLQELLQISFCLLGSALREAGSESFELLVGHIFS